MNTRPFIFNILPLVAILLPTSFAMAQSTDELLQMSRSNFGLGTARSAAMGGAFTSLGADASSMSINPAGIAMYKSSEITVSPGLRITSSGADYRSSNYSNLTEQGRTRFNIGNAAAIYSNGKFAVGFGLNRLADYNSRRTIQGYGERVSIGQMFMEQLYGIPSSSLNTGNNDPYQIFMDYRNRPDLWGAIMGYRTGMVDPTSKNADTYNMADIFNYQDGDIQDPQAERITSGANNEYTLSGGYNFNDILYIGGTIGVQDIYINRSDRYSELASSSNTGALDNMTYRQNLRLHSTGVNFKVGATVRPLGWLRIGVSYHSPTWLTTVEEYDADMTVYDLRYTTSSGALDPAYSQTPILAQEYDTRTPSRLLAGISATIGSVAIISVDYERAWYNSMKFTSRGFNDLNDNISNNYRATDNVRAGVEVQPIKSLFVRAGYGFSGSVYKSSEMKQWSQFSQYSGGVGYRNGFFSIDFAYIYSQMQYQPYKMFSYTASDGYTVEPKGTIYADVKNHNVIMTLGFKF